MKKVFIIPMVITLLVALIAGAACTGTKETEGAKLPVLKIGDQWVYRWVQGTTEYTATQEVTRDEVVQGVDCYVMNWTYESPMGDMSGMQIWIDKETLSSFTVEQRSFKNLFNVTCTQITISTHKALEGAYWPLEVGGWLAVTRTATTVTMCGAEVSPEHTTQSNYTSEVEKREEVSIPAGKFDCFKVIMRDGDGNLLYDRWYSDMVKNDVKTVAYDAAGNATYTMELESYSV